MPDEIEIIDVPPYHVESTVDGGTVIRRTVQTAWTSVGAFPAYMLGDVSEGAGAEGGNLLRRTLPKAHPSKSWLYASEVSLEEGLGAPGEDATGTLTPVGMLHHYDNQPGNTAKTGGKARWTVTYRARPYEVHADGVGRELDRFVIREPDVTIEALALPGNSFKWEVDGITIPEGIAIQRMTEAMAYTWVWVPNTRVTRLRVTTLPKICGRVNSAEFDGFGVGTVLCLAPKITPLSYTPEGTPVRDVTFHFLRRVDGTTWNQFFRHRSGGGRFENVVSVGAPNKPPPFDSADFNDLFK